MFDCEGGSSGLLTLHYGKHNLSILDEIKEWSSCDTLADMTIICEKGQTLKAHRLILASASPLVKRLLEDCDSHFSRNNVVLQLPDVKESHMRIVLSFLYTGEVNVQINELDSITELLRLFEMKSELWDTACTEDDIKTNTSLLSDEDEEEEEEEEEDVEISCSNRGNEDENTSPSRSRRRSSSIPINLSVPNKVDSKSLSPDDKSISKFTDVHRKTRRKSSPEVDDARVKESTEAALSHLQDRSNWPIRLKRPAEIDYYPHLNADDDEDDVKIPVDLIHQQSVPDKYVVTPHRKRRPGFHNSPSQNPFSPSYVDELSHIRHRRFLNPTTIDSVFGTTSYYLADRIRYSSSLSSQTQDVPHLEQLVDQYAAPSEERLTSAVTETPESSPARNDTSNHESAWPSWSGQSPTMLPFVKTESSTPPTEKRSSSHSDAEETCSENEQNVSKQHSSSGSTRQYKCEFCEKIFGMSWNLKTHLRVHTGEKPFGCRLCISMFKQKAHLLKHLCSVHRAIIQTENGESSATQYNCCFCELSFDTMQELIRHFSGPHNSLLLSKNFPTQATV